MSAEVDLPGYGDDLLAARQPAAEIAIAPADVLREVRRVKRLTQLGVYAGIVGSLPVYSFLLGFSAFQLLTAFAVGMVIATAAIEKAFAEMCKLRKRSAYPGALALHLGALPSFDAACQAISPIMDKLLRLRGSFLTLKSEAGFFSLVALGNLSRVEADRYLRLGASGIERAISSRSPVVLRAADDLLAEALAAPGRQATFVPVQSLQRVIGVLGLVGDDSNAELRDEELMSAVGTALGVSLESLRQRDDLRRLAAIDELTKVYNRHYFFDQFTREIAVAGRYEAPVSVLLFDLDGLKRMNDSLGHGAGDDALRAVAQRLVRFSRASDIVARLGGDEFAVILPRTDREAATEVAKRLQTSVEGDPLTTSGQELRLAVSCGLASYPEDAADVNALLREADGRMYAAKAARYGASRKQRG